MDRHFISYVQAGPAPSKPPAEWKIPVFDYTFQPVMSKLWHVAVQGAKSNFGLMLIIAAQVFFAIINLLVKKLHAIDPPVGTLEIVVVRMGLTVLCCLTYMFWSEIPDPLLGPKGVRLLLAFRGFSGFLGLFGIYFALNYLSLADTTVLTFLVPLGTGFVASRFLGETFTKMEVLASVFSLLGVVLIARPPFLFGDSANGLGEDLLSARFVDHKEMVTPGKRLLAVCVAFLGEVGTVGAFTSLRAIGNRAHPLHSMVSLSTQSLIVASVAMLITREPFVFPAEWEWTVLLFGIAIAGFAAQTLLAVGFVHETAGRGTMGVYSQMVFAVVLQWMFFHSLPSTLSVIGSLMIISSAMYVVIRKHAKEQAHADRGILESTGDVSLEEGLRTLGK